jgi:hypothetical protein
LPVLAFEDLVILVVAQLTLPHFDTLRRCN